MSELTVTADEVKQLVTVAQGDGSDLSLESLTLLINTERLHYLDIKTRNEFKELKRRQDDVSTLHKLIRHFNSHTDSKGNVTLPKDSATSALLQSAKDMGIELDVNKFSYTKEERDLAIENCRMTVEDLNVLNDMQLQTITRLTNERYESYQLARAILKPLHDDKINKSRAISGR